MDEVLETYMKSSGHVHAVGFTVIQEYGENPNTDFINYIFLKISRKSTRRPEISRKPRPRDDRAVPRRLLYLACL